MGNERWDAKESKGLGRGKHDGLHIVDGAKKKRRKTLRKIRGRKVREDGCWVHADGVGAYRISIFEVRDSRASANLNPNSDDLCGQNQEVAASCHQTNKYGAKEAEMPSGMQSKDTIVKKTTITYVLGARE